MLEKELNYFNLTTSLSSSEGHSRLSVPGIKRAGQGQDLECRHVHRNMLNPERLIELLH